MNSREAQKTGEDGAYRAQAEPGRKTDTSGYHNLMATAMRSLS